MRFLRTWRSLLATGALTLQVGVMVAASTALCCGHDEPSKAATSEMACCKDAGKAHVCPLPPKAAPANPNAPRLKSCCDIDQQLIAALFGTVGIVGPEPSAVPAPEMSTVIVGTSEQPIALVRQPDSPPPRA